MQAGHSGRVRPGPIPNPEVKPVVAAALLICVSDWKTAVLAFIQVLAKSLSPFYSYKATYLVVLFLIAHLNLTKELSSKKKIFLSYFCF